MNTKNSTWFQCKVQLDRVTKNVTETYVVDAESYTEAETIINQVMPSLTSGRFTIADITKANYKEVVFDDFDLGDDGRYYRVKLTYITENENTGAEKRINTNVLVYTESVSEVLRLLRQYMSGSLSTAEVSAVVETPIKQLFEKDIKK